MSRWRLGPLLVALASCVAGCPGSLYVKEVMPHPNIDVPQQKKRLGLSLADDIPESYEVGAQNGVRDVFVQRWRASLIHGYRAAYGEAFVLDDKKPEIVLQLIEAKLEFGHTAKGLTAIVRYKAHVLDASGVIKSRRNGVAESKTGGHTDDATPLARSAVETLYEELAPALVAAAGEAPADED